MPIAQASQRNSDVQVPLREATCQDAPRIEIDQHLSEAEDQELWRHYGLNYDTGYADRAAQGRETEDVELICSGDHRSASLASTPARSRGSVTSLAGLGRWARRKAAASAAWAR